ncbi:hypothetical protein ACP70R_004389 [Stipagrostis hirtigluma subsp. patula]
MPTMTVPSAAMRKLKRATAAAKSLPAPTPHHSVGDDGVRHPFLALYSSSSSSGKGRATTPAATGGVQQQPTPHRPPVANENATVGIDARVVVRKLVTVPSGCRLVFLLSAVVVFTVDDEDGCLEVVYDGRFPPDRQHFCHRARRKMPGREHAGRIQHLDHHGRPSLRKEKGYRH